MDSPEKTKRKEADLSGQALPGVCLRNAKLPSANLNKINFTGADLQFTDLRGTRLNAAILREANLTGAQLNDASLECADLAKANLKNADLTNADLSYADLTGANLSGAVIENTRLFSATLDKVNFEDTSLDIPTIKNIHQMVYSAVRPNGALDMKCWHSSCGTSHCRAGWVITLAGDRGKVLEYLVGTANAARLIYQKSDPSDYELEFFTFNNEEAMKEIRHRAEVEADLEERVG